MAQVFLGLPIPTGLEIVLPLPQPGKTREFRSPFSRWGNRGLERRRDQPEAAPNALRRLEPRTRGHLVRGHPPLLVEGFGPNWELWTQKRLSHCFLSYSPMAPAAPP